MKKNSIGLATVMLLLTGCNTTAQPQFDPNIRTIVPMGGMLYPIPYKSDYSNKPMPKKAVKWAKKNNVDCKEGDIGWTSPGTREKVEGKGYAALLAAYRNGQMGCVPPLTRIEEKRYNAFIVQQKKIKEEKLARLSAKKEQIALRIAKLEQKDAERKTAYIAQKTKLKNTKTYSSNSSTSSYSPSKNSRTYSSNKNSQSMQEGLDALNRQLRQMTSDMEKRSYYYPSNSYSPPNYSQSSSSSYNGYKGNSGTRYQYDSSKYEDRIRYQYDYNAQYRDSSYTDYSGNRGRDTSSGQFGMGIYGQ